MDESQKKKSFDAIMTAINMAAMGAGIAAAAIAAGKSRTADADASRIERNINELNAKFDRILERLKSVQQPEVGTTTMEAEKKQEGGAHQHRQQDVIYVRKSSEFSFYN